MTHLQSLIAKAKAATPGPWEITEDSAGGKDEAWCHWHQIGPFDLTGEKPTADGLFIASCNPHLILALCELAMAAEEVQYHVARAGPIDGEQSLEDAFTALDAKLAAVRGVGAT